MKNHSNTELIEQYLQGDLSGIEKIEFEKQLSVDPILKDEVDLQKDITEAIKNVRRSELKAALNNTTVSTGVSSTKKWMLAAAAITFTIGSIGYLTTSNNDKTIITEESTQSSVIEKVITENEKTKSNTELSQEEVIDVSGEQSIGAENIVNETISKDKATIKTATSTPTNKKEVAITDNNKESKDAIQYSFDDPEFDVANENDGFSSHQNLETPNSGLSSNTTNSSSKEIIPKIENSNKSARKYRYDGENLTLIGDFSSEQPYVLYDLALKESNSLYLLFQEQYFEIKNTHSKTVKLEKVNNPNIIAELKRK